MIRLLDKQIKKVCPIHGVSIGRKNDKTTWRIDFKDEATKPQKKSAQTVFDNFDITTQPTSEDRIDEAFPQTDIARVIFEAFFELANRLQVLESKPAITRAQLKTWLKAKLP